MLQLPLLQSASCWPARRNRLPGPLAPSPRNITRLASHGRLSYVSRLPSKNFSSTAAAPAAAGGNGEASTSAPTATPAGQEGQWAPLNGRTAVIVGAGPAGCTLAMYLARAGWQVQVYERRPEPGPATTSRQRSWVLAMYPRGIRPVNAVAQVPLLAERAYKGLVIQPPKPGDKPIVLERSGVLMDRTLLATTLLDAARGQYGSRVSFTFNASISQVEPGRRAAFFSTTTTATAAATGLTAAEEADSSSSVRSQGDRELVGAVAGGGAVAMSVHGGVGSSSSGGGGGVAAAATAAAEGPVLEASYDLLVGADGSGSTLRSLLAQAFPGQFETEVLSPGTGVYKSVYGLPAIPEVEAWDPDSAVPPEQRVQGQFFFFLSGGKKGMMSMCRDIDGAYCGYLAGRAEMFEALKTKEDYIAILPQAAPQLPAAWLPLIADQMLAAPVSSFPTMRSLSRFWAPGGVVLVGDAAHTVTPALGQGLNSALEDCELLAAELATDPQLTADGIDAALRRFSESRAPEVRALQELELLQSSSLAPLKGSTLGSAPLLLLLRRKWVVVHYSGLALLGTVAATWQAAHAAKQRKEGREAPAVTRSDRLSEQLNATYVRSPPMYELLKAHMGYRDMLTRVYGMAALGTGCTAAILYGVWSGLAALVAVMRVALLAG